MFAAGVCCLGASQLFFTGCAEIPVYEAKLKEDRIEINIDTFGNSNSIVIKSDHDKAPLFIRKNDKGEYIAFSLVCSHRGCILDTSKEVLVCPCHGAEFNRDGKVLKGPALSDLEQFSTKIHRNKLTVFFTNF